MTTVTNTITNKIFSQEITFTNEMLSNIEISDKLLSDFDIDLNDNNIMDIIANGMSNLDTTNDNMIIDDNIV